MGISQFTKPVTTYLHGKVLRMFRFDCVDSEVGQAVKLREIVTEYYRNKPPFGFDKQGNSTKV